ncbi:hypothetical protein [Saccharicrinis fermentans]|uniref:PepSY domain-containing protein n=1 Tax=Saccharicrinis fermentans DSM 9555 = JCM 21142 TaxID=869213 RepID=W7YKH0_9BACT|nr:hypothetical protein [Saccharicrinis fermentans]GAF02854.1 hypothetical protein JCM21142_41499 [Saccharicrinis fermentans DSM 9555 = JCM 21142]
MKSIVIMAFVALLGSTALFATMNVQVKQAQVVAVEDELAFTEIAVDKIPQLVADKFAKENEGVAIFKAYTATKADGKVVYKISVKDAEGQVQDFFYNEDGSACSK